MLKRIQIKGFCSCRNVLLEDLGHLTALVGRNGSGKTNIFRAIDWLARTASVTDLARQFTPAEDFSSLALTTDIDLKGPLYRYSLALSPEAGSASSARRQHFTLKESLALHTPPSRWETILSRNAGDVHIPGRATPIRLGPLVPCLPGLLALLPDEDGLLQHIRSLLCFFTRTRYYPVDETNLVPPLEGFSLVGADEFQKWLTLFQASGPWQDSVLMRLLYAHLHQPDLFAEVRSLLGSKGLDLIDDITVEPMHLGTPPEHQPDGTPPYYYLAFRPGRALGKSPKLLSYGQLSLGTRRVLLIITSLLLDRSSLFLLEHPEDGIHRGLLRKLIGLLRANTDPAQVILSSHSALVLNDLTPQDVRLVSIHRGATQVRVLSPKEITAAARFIDEDGTLADFLETVEG